MAKNVSVQLLERTLVVVHTHRAPSDDDWQIFMQAWQGNLDDVRAQLVVSDGGVPSAEQRRELLALMGKRSAGPPATAVLTVAPAARDAVIALRRLIGDRIHAFSPDAMGDACRFLRVAHQQRELRECVRHLRRQLSPLPAGDIHGERSH